MISLLRSLNKIYESTDQESFKVSFSELSYQIKDLNYIDCRNYPLLVKNVDISISNLLKSHHHSLTIGNVISLYRAIFQLEGRSFKNCAIIFAFLFSEPNFIKKIERDDLGDLQHSLKVYLSLNHDFDLSSCLSLIESEIKMMDIRIEESNK